MNIPSLWSRRQVVVAVVAIVALAIVHGCGSEPDAPAPQSPPSAPAPTIAAPHSVLPTESAPEPPTADGAINPTVEPTPTAVAGAVASAIAPTITAASCKPTDQDRYVYNPDRLIVQAACLRVSGVIDAIRQEADGDLHILLRLDSADRHYLTPANQGEELGDLVIEPICVHPVSQADAVQSCAADPDPLQNSAAHRGCGLDGGSVRPRQRARRLGRAPSALSLGIGRDRDAGFATNAGADRRIRSNGPAHPVHEGPVTGADRRHGDDRGEDLGRGRLRYPGDPAIRPRIDRCRTGCPRACQRQWQRLVDVARWVDHEARDGQRCRLVLARYQGGLRDHDLLDALAVAPGAAWCRVRARIAVALRFES